MGLKQRIREKLAVCGDCINCKLVTWESKKGIEADKYMTFAGRNDGLEGEDDNSYFIVRCSWLKNAVSYPLALTGCEGKKSFLEEKEEG